MPNETAKIRKTWLDAIKGVAIVLVILSHSQEIPFIHWLLVACYMPLFFLASGYTFRDYAGVLNKRWKQLLIPYAGWCLFYLVWGISADIHAEKFSISDVALKVFGILYSRYSFFPPSPENELMLFPNGAMPMWFLTCLAVSYAVALPLIRANRAGKIFISTLYLVISVALSYIPILLPWSLDTAFLGAIFIFLGHLAKSIHLSTKQIFVTLLISSFSYLTLSYINPGINMSVKQYGNMGRADALGI